MDIGNKLKTLRKNSDLTLEEVAKKLNVTKQTIFKYENGITENIPLNNIEKMAELFNVPPGYIMGWQENTYLNSSETHLIENYRNSTQAGKDKILNYSRDISKLYQYIPTREEMIEYLDGIQYAAFDGGTLDELSDEELYNIYKALKDNE